MATMLTSSTGVADVAAVRNGVHIHCGGGAPSVALCPPGLAFSAALFPLLATTEARGELALRPTDTEAAAAAGEGTTNVLVSHGKAETRSPLDALLAVAAAQRDDKTTETSNEHGATPSPLAAEASAASSPHGNTCPQCSRAIAGNRGQLNRHLTQCHSTERRHRCKYPGCGKAFKQHYELLKHGASHSEERPYRCGHCHHAFKLSSTLAQHRRNVHADEPDDSEDPRATVPSRSHSPSLVGNASDRRRAGMAAAASTIGGTMRFTPMGGVPVTVHGTLLPSGLLLLEASHLTSYEDERDGDGSAASGGSPYTATWQPIFDLGTGWELADDRQPCPPTASLPRPSKCSHGVCPRLPCDTELWDM
jgi:hypothetical protein